MLAVALGHEHLFGEGNAGAVVRAGGILEVLGGFAAVEDGATLDANVVVGGSSFIDRIMPNGRVYGVVVDGLGLVDPLVSVR